MFSNLLIKTLSLLLPNAKRGVERQNCTRGEKDIAEVIL